MSRRKDKLASELFSEVVPGLILTEIACRMQRSRSLG
jgi:hypothetical protein